VAVNVVDPPPGREYDAGFLTDARDADGAEAPRPRSRLRRAALLLAACFVALAILVVAALAIALSDARLTALVNGTVSDALPGKLVVGAVRWSMPLTVVIEDAKLSTPAGAQVAHIGRAEATASLAGVFGQRVAVTAAVEGGDATIELTDDGELTLLQALVATSSAPPEEGPSPIEGWTIAVEDVRVRDFAIALRVPGLVADVAVASVDAGATVAMATIEAGADVRVRAIHIREPELPVGPIAIAVDGAAFAMTGDDARVTVTAVTASIDGAKATVRGSLVGLDPAIAQAELTTELDVDATKFSSLAPEAVTLAGKLSGEVALKGGMSAADVRIDLSGAALKVAGTEISSIGGAVRKRGDRVEVEELAIAIAGGAVRLGGHAVLPPGSPVHDLTVAIERLGARAAAAAFVPDPSIIPEHVDGDIALAGAGWFDDLTPPLASQIGLNITVSGLPAPIQDERFVAGGDVELSLARAVLRRMRVDGAGLELTATGTVPIAAERLADLQVRLHHPAAGKLTSAFGVPVDAGRLDVKATVRGALASPRVDAHVSVDGVSTAGLPAASAKVPAALRDGVATIRGAEVTIAGGTVALDATATVLRDGAPLADPPFEGSVLIAGIDVSELTDGFVTGAAGGDVAFSGTPKRPKARAQLQVDGLTVGEAPFSRAELLATVDGRRAKLERLVAAPSIGGTLTASGSFHLERQRLAATASVRQLPVAIANQIKPGTPELGGTVELSASVGGTAERPTIAATLLVPGISVDGRAVGTLSSTISGDLSELLAKANLQTALGRADVDALVRPLRRLAEVQVAADRVEPLPGVFVTTRAAASVDARNTLRANASLDVLDLVVYESPLALTEPARIDFDGSTVHLSQVHLHGPASELKVEGRAGDEIDVSARGSIDVSMATALVSAVTDLRGRVDLDVVAKGPAASPKLLGEISIGDGGILARPRELIREIRVDRGVVRLLGDRVRIEGVAGAVRGGAFQARGDIALAGLMPSDLNVHLTGQNMPFATRDLSVEGNADLRLQGNLDEPVIRGKLDLVRGRYRRGIALEDLQLVLLEPDLDAGPSEHSPILDKILLDIRAFSQDSMDIDVDAAALAVKSRFGADLRIAGTAGRPLIEGRVDATTGHIDFPAGRLAVQSIALDFVPTADAKIDPNIDVVASGEITPEAPPGQPEITYLVTMTLTGKMSDMQLELVSSPSLTRVEILTLLIAGTADVESLLAAAEDSGKPADAEDADNMRTAMVFAGSVLAGPITSFLSDQLEQQLQLKVKLKAEVTDEDAKVSAVQEVHPRIRLEGSYQHAYDTERRTAAGTGRFLVTDEVFVEGGAEDVAGTADEDGTEGWVRLKVRVLGDE